MPVEIKSLEEFRKIAERAVECRVKKVKPRGKKGNGEKEEKEKEKEIVKIKARTKRYLYTIKVEADKADEIVSGLPCKRIVYVDEGRVVEKK